MSKKKTDINLSLPALKTLGTKLLGWMSRYAGIMFFVLVATVYGFVILRVNLLSNAQPTQSEIDAQVNATSAPKIDPQVAKQLQSLEDNSVNVQTLFDDARHNPFQ